MAMLTNRRILQGAIAPNHVYCGEIGWILQLFFWGFCVPSYVPSYVHDCGLFQIIRLARILYCKETIYSELILVINL